MKHESLVLLIDQTRAEVAELAAKRKAAWDPDPGNINMGHVWLSSMGYHYWFREWQVARERLVALERQLSKLGAAA